MNTLKRTQKTLVSLLIALAIIISQIGLILFYQLRTSPFALALSEITESINGLNDPSFSKYTSNSSGNPYKPTYWSEAGGNASSVKAGVISVDNTEFNNSTNNGYGLTTNPESKGDDDYILMIKSNDKATNYGYKNSGTITLESNNYYKITVLCKTDVVGNNGASIYLNSNDIKQTNQYNFVNINTHGEWETYTFYVQTNPYQSSSVNIELWLGSNGNITSNGAVFFDDVHVYKLNQNEYYQETTNPKYDFTNVDKMPLFVRNIDLKKVVLADEQFLNSNFEQGNIEWEQTEGVELPTTKSINGIANITNSSETLTVMGLEQTETNPGSSNTYNNKKALFINNKEEATVTYATKNAITIKQHNYYKLSLLLKTGNINGGGASIEVKQVTNGDDAEGALTKKLESLTSSSGLSQYNGYQEYSLYICGNPYQDEQVKLYLSLNVAGYVIFDDISIQHIDYSYYNSNSADKNLVLHSEPDTQTINNGAFNFSSNESSTVKYPLLATNWTTESKTSGIISVNGAHFEANKANYGSSVVNPGPVTNYPNADQTLNSKNNVLMIRNDSPSSYAEYKSTTFSVSANSSTDSIIGVSVWVKTQTNLSNQTSGAAIKLVTDSGVVLAQVINIRTYELSVNNDWQQYFLYINNSISSSSCRLVLSLGTEENPTSGYAYFDNVEYLTSVQLETITSQDSSKYCYTNLATDSFDSSIANENNVNTPYTFAPQGTTPTATTAGVINLANISNHILTIEVPVREGTTDNNMLMIKNNSPETFTYKSTITRNFAEGSHYKISVWVYTANLSTTSENAEKAYGANIKVSNLDQQFNNIITDTEENNGWVQYTFYIKASGTADTDIYLSLGSEEVPVQGYVFFDDVVVTTVTEEDYNKVDVKKLTNTIKNATTVQSDVEDDTTTPEDEEEKAPSTPINLWILVPSLILALALVVAIVGYAMRKVKFRNPFARKQKQSAYSREVTLHSDIVKRELAEQRRIKVKEIDAQVEAVNVLIKENKDSYETALKDKKNKGKEQKLFTKYAKERTRLQKQLDNLASAKAYILDEDNIRAEEEKEIRRRQYLLENENKQIVKQATTNPQPKVEEKVEEQPKEESEAVKKARARAKMKK